MADKQKDNVILTDEYTTLEGTIRMSGENLKPLPREKLAAAISSAMDANISSMRTRKFNPPVILPFWATLVRGRGLDWKFELDKKARSFSVGGGLVGVSLRLDPKSFPKG